MMSLRKTVFAALALSVSADRCDVGVPQRMECGNYTTKQEDCEQNGCCWKPAGFLNKTDHAPWCFFQNTPPVPNDLCAQCKNVVNQLAGYGTKGACTAACELIPGAEALCPFVCGLIPNICGPKAIVPCGDAVCSAISVCAHNPWMYESVWDFSKSTDTPNLGHEDRIVLTSTEPSNDVPAGTVKIGIKCTAGTWWKAVTMFKGTKFLREVAHEQDHKGETNWGSVSYADLKDHYFSLSKAKFLGVHTNIYHITNIVEMKERGTYLFDWQKDGFEEELAVANATDPTKSKVSSIVV